MQISKIKMKFEIPPEVRAIMDGLTKAGYEAYIVGGCVRDLIMDKTPKDWDVTTNAKPEEVQKIFSSPEGEPWHSFYENDFGTVGVVTGSETPTLAVIEVTTYRSETGYSDKRRPDEVRFVATLQEDLKRRDFTMNAVALSVSEKAKVPSEVEGRLQFIDPYGGQEDIKNKIIKAVGDAEERFAEDALRMMRAVRFGATLGFAIEDRTHEEIKAHSHNIKHVSQERVRDEFSKLINGAWADRGIELLRETNLLDYVVPELLEGVGVTQNLHHIYSVWEHNVRSLAYTVEKNYSVDVRLAALFHDIGKPRSKRGEGYNSTFYGHEVIGARMAKEVLKRLKFPQEMTEKISKLVRYHMFYYLPEEVTESSVRRLVANIGKENVEDLLKLREADRIGSGTPKAIPYKLRHLKFMIDKVARDPISPKMLKVDGNDIMKLLEIPPGPKVGMIMNALMEEVLDDPTRNTREYLETESLKLKTLSEEELKKLSQQGKEKSKEMEDEEVDKIKVKHFVK